MKKYPNITVVHTGFPFNAYWPTKILAAEAAHQGPDVMMTYTEANLDKGFIPLNGYASETGLKAESPLIGSEEAADPSLHQLPLTTDPYMLQINKTLFRKAGLTAPPTTFSQLVQDCGKLNAAGITPISEGFQDGHGGENWILYGFASQTFSPAQIQAFDAGKLKWNAPPMQAALRDLTALNNAKCFEANSASYTQSEGYENFFAAGKSAMEYIDASGSLTAEAKTFGNSNLEAVPLPRVAGDRYSKPFLQETSYYDWAITRWTKECRASWAYLSFLYSPAAQKVLYKVGGLFPNVTTVHGASSVTAQRQELSDLSIASNHSGPVNPLSVTASTVYKLYPELIAGQVNVPTFVSQADATFQGATVEKRPFQASPVCR